MKKMPDLATRLSDREAVIGEKSTPIYLIAMTIYKCGGPTE